jgi:hypothetical protein
VVLLYFRVCVFRLSYSDLIGLNRRGGHMVFRFRFFGLQIQILYYNMYVICQNSKFGLDRTFGNRTQIYWQPDEMGDVNPKHHTEQGLTSRPGSSRCYRQVTPSEFARHRLQNGLLGAVFLTPQGPAATKLCFKDKWNWDCHWQLFERGFGRCLNKKKLEKSSSVLLIYSKGRENREELTNSATLWSLRPWTQM